MTRTSMCETFYIKPHASYVYLASTSHRACCAAQSPVYGSFQLQELVPRLERTKFSRDSYPVGRGSHSAEVLHDCSRSHRYCFLPFLQRHPAVSFSSVVLLWSLALTTFVVGHNMLMLLGRQAPRETTATAVKLAMTSRNRAEMVVV